jgi:hypothetical protein
MEFLGLHLSMKATTGYKYLFNNFEYTGIAKLNI